MAEQKLCVRCTKPAELLCSRCSDSYCSVECQKADWQNHRLICFRMPTLLPDLSKMQIYSSNLAFAPPTNMQVCSNSLPQLYANIQNDLNSAKAKPSEPTNVDQELKEVQTAPQKQQVAIKKFNETKEPKGPEPEKAEPVAKPEVITVQNVEEVKAKVFKAPTFTRPLRIEVQKEAKTPEPARVMKDELSCRDWPVTKSVKVKILNMLSQNTITLRVENECIDQYYDLIGNKIAEHCEGKVKVNYRPVKGEVVLALFDNAWYRAHVLDPDASGSIVQFIDYGNVETVASDEMMAASTELKFDICARDFIIDNMVEELDEKQFEILNSGSITITNIRKAVDGEMHCSIFGF